ncbi:MAG: hypothetical protein IPP17_29605 [Bacteroidetes bacterium]|nr:hypothetical protein [Bacteroidota bacterium]
MDQSSEDERSEGTQLEVLELIASAVPIPLEHPIERKGSGMVGSEGRKMTSLNVADSLVELLVYLPGLMERVFFGNLKAMITPLILNQTDSLQEWLSIDDEKELEIEAAYEEFKFTTEEEATFVGNRDFGRLVLGIADRFGFEIPFQYRRCLVALEKGWISANELIIFGATAEFRN